MARTLTRPSHVHNTQTQELKSLIVESKRLHCDQSTKLDQISRILNGIKAQVDHIQFRRADAPPPVSQLESLEKQLAKMSVSQKNVDKELGVLRSLYFSARPVRHQCISDAHRETFLWAFEPPAESPAGSTYLSNWMRNGEGVFWVSGKPGSGKSTFMKFVADESRTRRLLSQWSPTKKLAVASYYFWNAGTTIQKSAEGLLRALLYEIFRQCPEVRDLIYDRAVRPTERGDTAADDHDTEIHSTWSPSHLQAALEAVANRESLSVKFCFFIDGLDEYDGDHLDLCRTLLKLSEIPDIKVCVSSRPWNVFEQAFGADPQRKIYMHHLTHKDILNYTRCRMQDHPGWSSLVHEDPLQSNWVIEEVASRSSGVFLWVFLVTKQLREGLTNQDSAPDLRRRLESIPIELEAFFRQILESVDPFYHGKMAAMLQVATKAELPLLYTAFDFLEQEHADRDYVFQLPVEPYPQDKTNLTRERVSRWLDGRTRGLLEMDRSDVVNFLHRTVADFLKTREMASYLTEKSPGWFMASFCLLKIYLAMVKTGQFSERSGYGGNRIPLKSLTTAILSITAELPEGGSLHSTIYQVISELDRVLVEKFTKNQATMDEDYPGETFLRCQMMNGGNLGFLTTKLARDASYFASFGNLLVPHLLIRESNWEQLSAQPQTPLCNFVWSFDNKSIKTLQLVLKTQRLELNNYSAGGSGIPRTPWTWLLEKMEPSRKLPSTADTTVMDVMTDWEFWTLVGYDIFDLMLDRGADPLASVTGERDYHYQAPEGNRGRAVSSKYWIGCGLPALVVYCCRGWRAPPTKGHEEKFLHTLRRFAGGGTILTKGCSDGICAQLEKLGGKTEAELLPRSWSIMVDSVDVLLESAGNDVPLALHKKRHIVGALLTVAETAFPPGVLSDLKSRYAHFLSPDTTRAAKAKRPAEEELGGDKKRSAI